MDNVEKGSIQNSHRGSFNVITDWHCNEFHPNTEMDQVVSQINNGLVRERERDLGAGLKHCELARRVIQASAFVESKGRTWRR